MLSRHAVRSAALAYALSTLTALAASAALPDRTIELTLRLQERTPMEELARTVTDPTSPRYGRFYSPEEIRALAAPTDADYADLVTALEGRGFVVSGESRSHLIVKVLGQAALIEHTLGVQLLPLSPGGGVSSVLGVPAFAALGPIVSVSGLDTTRRSHPLHRARAHARPALGGDDFDGYTSDTIQSVYGMKPIYASGITGKGQHIAIAGYDSYQYPDIVQYYDQIGLATPPTVDQVIFNGQPDLDPDSAVENEMDAEFAGMMAPRASIHMFMSAQNNDAGEVQLFTAVLDDNRAKIVNYSWGDCESHVSAQHHQDMTAIFARAVAQGVNIVVAAGDSGSAGCEDSGSNTVADWPAANPYVLGVGGTSIDPSGNSPGETTWDGTGGGFSAYYAAPSWQAGLSSTQGNTAMRAFPDVAFNADPNSGEPAWVHYPATLQWVVFGGTSIAAPQWSGFLALVGEARGDAGPVGYLPPKLYSLSGAQRSAGFHDVTKGNNGAYKAQAGWDPTTGWGSPVGSALLGILAGQ